MLFVSKSRILRNTVIKALKVVLIWHRVFCVSGMTGDVLFARWLCQMCTVAHLPVMPNSECGPIIQDASFACAVGMSLSACWGTRSWLVSTWRYSQCCHTPRACYPHLCTVCVICCVTAINCALATDCGCSYVTDETAAHPCTA